MNPFALPSFRRATTRSARIAATLLVAFAVTVGGLLSPLAAGAAELPGAITAVTAEKSSYGYNERLKLAFEWEVADTSVEGDTFTLALPDELKALTLAKFSLLAPDGSVVANATWSGKTVLFTLTDYVDSHDLVSGSGFLTAQWDHAVVPETSQPIVLEFASNAVEIVIGDKPAPSTPCTTDCPPPPATPTTRSLSKSGGWADGAYEGTRDVTGNINWKIALPGNESGYAGPIEIVDTPQLGSITECATIAVDTQSGLAGGTPRVPVDPSRYTLDCAATAFTIALTEIAPNEFITISYKGTITDQSSGAYGNHVAVTIAGTTTLKDTIIKRTDAGGGIGGGTQSVSVGNYVWLDSGNDGVQNADEKGIAGVTLVLTGPDGLPVTNIDAALVGPTKTDTVGLYNFAKLPVLLPGQHYTVTIDQKASATALTGLSPTAAGIGDTGTDSSTDFARSASLVTNGARDETLDFGFVVPQLPTLPFPEEQPLDGTLAYTGSTIEPWGFASAGLFVLGAGALLLARRRKA